MKIQVIMQKNNDTGQTIIGQGRPDKAFAHALRLLSIQGNDPKKILKAMETVIKEKR